MFLRIIAGFSSALALCLSALIPAQADSEGYIDHFNGAFNVSRKDVYRAPQTVLNSPLAYAMDHDWTVLEPQIHDELISRLSALRFSGQNLYDISAGFPDSGELRAIDFGNNKVGLKYVLNGNWISATSTQPYVGKWGDPSFSIRYDAAIYINLSTPHQTGTMSVESATVRVSNPNVDTHGVIADVASFLVSVIGGIHINNLAAHAMQNQSVDITNRFKNSTALTYADAILSDSAKAGYTVTVLSANPNAVVLQSIRNNTSVRGPVVVGNPGKWQTLAGSLPGANAARAPISQRVQLNPQPLPPGMHPTSISATRAFAAENYTSAATGYQGDVALHPDDAVAHYNLGYSYFKLGQNAKARAELQRAAALAKNPGFIQHINDLLAKTK